MSKTITVIDIETTGLDPEADKVVEIATVEVRPKIQLGHDEEKTFSQIEEWLIGEPWSSLVDPGKPIPPEASAIHHIVDADVADAPSLEACLSRGGWIEWLDVIAGHNCRFDRAFLPMFHGLRWLDTYRCAMHIWPDAPNYQLQTLRYWLKLDLPRGRQAHKADADALTTAHLLVRQLAERSVDDLLSLSIKRVVLRKVAFGKHFGQLWTDVPTSYLDWAWGQKDMDPDVQFTVQTELRRRAS